MERQVLWYAIDVHNASLCKEPAYKVRSHPKILNSYVTTRDRSVAVPWPAVRHILDLVSYAGRDPVRYKALYVSRQYYFTDELAPMPEWESFKGVTWMY